MTDGGNASRVAVSRDKTVFSQMGLPGPNRCSGPGHLTLGPVPVSL